MHRANKVKIYQLHNSVHLHERSVLISVHVPKSYTKKSSRLTRYAATNFTWFGVACLRASLHSILGLIHSTLGRFLCVFLQKKAKLQSQPKKTTLLSRTVISEQLFHVLWIALWCGRLLPTKLHFVLQLNYRNSHNSNVIFGFSLLLSCRTRL